MIRLGLETIELVFQSVPENAVEKHKISISSWYCKPAILESLGDYLNRYTDGALLFITCSKYGCRQFLPKFHYTFPINDTFEGRFRNYDVIVPVFDDLAIPFKKK